MSDLPGKTVKSVGMNQTRFEALFSRHLDDSLTKREESELMRMLDDRAAEPAVKDMIGNHWERWLAGEWPGPGDSEALYGSIREEIGAGDGERMERRRLNRRAAMGAVAALCLSAAACIVLGHYSQAKQTGMQAVRRLHARAAAPAVADTSENAR